MKESNLTALHKERKDSVKSEHKDMIIISMNV